MTAMSDPALEILAYDLAMLRERVVDLVAERDSYREVAQQAIHELHHVTIERDQYRDRYHACLDGLRRQRDEQRRAA
jgi:hypothetical protein